ncbi:MAG: glycosyltransferase family 2 protein [Patescibacteria group bacterium]
MKISVVTPVYNESKNIPILVGELEAVLNKLTLQYEIIAVNDGSKDDSFTVLQSLAKDNSRIKVINFQVNKGQTSALSAGIESAEGDVIITIDSDLENDPNDIPKLVEKIHEGFDVVSGWRKDRWKKQFIKRKLPSVVANWFISKITGIKLHDYGCILKAYKKEVLENTNLYGEMHRFIPAYAFWRGAKVTEIVVNQRPRIHGKSNYGIGRTFKVLLDLIVIKFLDKYMNRPMHFFGGIGFISLGVGAISGTLSLIFKIVGYKDFVQTPLPVFSALFVIVGVQLVVMGILAEILMRTYYESQGKKPYIIKSKINFK